MRILHIAPAYVPVLGGSEHHLKELSEGLVKRGHEVSVLTANVRSCWDAGRCKAGDLPVTDVINGVRILRLQPDGGLLGKGLVKWLGFRGGHRSLSLLFGPDGLEMLVHGPRIFASIPHIIRSRADVIATMNWYWAPAFHTYLARKLKRFTLVGIPLFHTASTWCRTEIYRQMLLQCDAVIANTQYEADFIRARSSGRVEVVGVGVHPEEFLNRDGEQMRARFRLGRHPIVGFVGRQVADKGAAVLVEAMKAVWRWNPEVHVILAGTRPKEPNEVDVVIDRLSPFERGHVVRIDEFPEKEKASLYDAFDVFALPSKEESFGIAYLEAWMCGKPVIGSRIGSTECVIDDGVDGLLIDRENPEDLAAKIIDLLADPGKGSKMGARGQAKVLSQHTWESVVEQVELLYQQLRVAPGFRSITHSSQQISRESDIQIPKMRDSK